MENSTLTAHFTNTGKFTTLEIENRHHSRRAWNSSHHATINVNYEPNPNRKLTQNWFTRTRHTIINDHNNTIVGDNLYLTNIKYLTENDETITFECDLYELHRESCKEEVEEIALEAAYDCMWKPKMDDKVYCEKYVKYFPEVDSWGIKLDDDLDMESSCTKDELYKVKTLSRGLAKVYFNDDEIGLIEQYDFGGTSFEGKWGGYKPDNPAQGYGQESDRWARHDFFGDTRTVVAEQMINEHWAKRMRDQKAR